MLNPFNHNPFIFSSLCPQSKELKLNFISNHVCPEKKGSFVFYAYSREKVDYYGDE